MNIEEVCRAFGEGKKLTNKEGYVYEIDKIGNNIKVIKPLAKTRGVSITPFVDPKSMSIYVEYNLTFHQAMFIANLKRVKNEKTSYIYHMCDGKLYTEQDVIVGLEAYEIDSKWKVVE